MARDEGVPAKAHRTSARATPAVGNLAVRIDDAERVLLDGRREVDAGLSAVEAPVASASLPALSYRLREPGVHTELHCSLADVVERVVTGRVSDGTLLGAGRSPPVLLGEVPELVRVARVSKAWFDSEVGRPPRWRSSLDRASLPGMLFMLAETRATGLLSLRAGARRKLVHFDAGVPCFVAGSEPSELIGARLVAGGVLPQEALDIAVARAVEQQRFLGELLVEMRVLSASEMLRRLVTQLDTRVLELGTWVEAQMAFTPGLKPGAVIPQSLGVPGETACRIVRRCYCDSEISDFLRLLGTSALTPARGLPGAGQPLPLLEAERGVVAAADGCGDIAALARRMAQEHALPAEATRRAVFLGLSAGLLESPAWVSPLSTSGRGTHR